NFSLICTILPQVILPSGHGPLTHFGPISLNKTGDTCFNCFNISVANSLISHCALSQHLWFKKLYKLLTFIVNTIFVSQALGKTYLASSIACFSALLLASFSFFPLFINLL